MTPFGRPLAPCTASLPSLAATLDRLVDTGCHDVLLLSYNGADPRLHLAPDDDRRLARAILDAHARRGDDLAIKLSVCFGDRLPEVPRVVSADDCGAGDELVAIDSAKRMLACSFHAEGTPVRSAAEALDRWRLRRRSRAHAAVRGCARPGLATIARPPTPHGARVVAWRGWASNHSTSYTLVGEMPSAAKASAFVADLVRLLDRCEALREGESVRAARRDAHALTLWELLGRRGEPPSPGWSTSAWSLASFPPLVVAGGSRRRAGPMRSAGRAGSRRAPRSAACSCARRERRCPPPCSTTSSTRA